MNLGFHDANVLNMTYENDDVIIILDEVMHNGVKVKASIEIRFVEEVQIDSFSVKKISMPTPYGDVLCIEIDDKSFFALIEWIDYSNKNKITHSYSIKSNNISVVLL